MKKRKLALLLAAVMTASAIGSAASVSAAELQEAEILEISDGEETAAADGFVPDETAPLVAEIAEEGAAEAPAAAAEDAVIEEEAAPAAETSDTEAEDAVSDEITIDSIEIASASEAAGLDAAVEEEISMEGADAVEADAEYTATEGTGVYDVVTGGDIFTFTAPSTGIYRAKLNVNETIYLYWSYEDIGNTKGDDYGDQSLYFSLQAGETVYLFVECNSDEYSRYRMTFEKIPAVTDITVRQTEDITAVQDRYDFEDKFSVTLTYGNGTSYTTGSLDGEDQYGYEIEYNVYNEAGIRTDSYVYEYTPGTYTLEVYVYADSIGSSIGRRVQIPFTVKPFDLSVYPTLTEDTVYQMTNDDDTVFTFTPSRDGTYVMSVKCRNDWGSVGRELYQWDGKKLNYVSDGELLKKGNTYLVYLYPNAYSYQFQMAYFPGLSRGGTLTPGVPLEGYYVSDGADPSKAAECTFTPETTGKYRLTVDKTAYMSNGNIRFILERKVEDTEDTWEDYSPDNVKNSKDSCEITSMLKEGETYRYRIYGNSSYKFNAVLTHMNLVDLHIVELPLQKSIARTVEGVYGYSLDGMKVQLTYSDGTVVTAVGKGKRLVDEQGNPIEGLSCGMAVETLFIFDFVLMQVECDGYSERFTVPFTQPEESLESLAENVQTPVTMPAGTIFKGFQFTASRTGEYTAEINGRTEEYYNDTYAAQIMILDKNRNQVSRLEAGTTYYVYVVLRLMNYTNSGNSGFIDMSQIAVLQDTTLTLYVGDPGSACRFEVTSETPATCTAAGQRVYTCTSHTARETRTEVIPKLDHVKDEGTVTVQPTCTSEGSKVYRCKVCQAELYTETLPKLDHTADAGTVTAAPTALKEGVRTYKCTVCGKTLSTGRIAKLKATMKVTAGSLKLKVGQSTKKFKVTGLAKGDYVKYWKTNDKSVVTVKGTKKGTCTIKATKKAGSATITIFLASGKTKNIKVTVQKTAVATTKITGVASKLTVKKGKSATLKPVLSPFTSVEKITYTTSDKKIATVSSKGKIVGKKKGTATITVKAGKKSVKCKVTVK